MPRSKSGSANGGVIGVSNKSSFGKCTVTSITSTGCHTTQPGTQLLSAEIVAGGGSGGNYPTPGPATGGVGGGGAGGGGCSPYTAASAGTVNTGGGGGGASGPTASPANGGTGGSGIVIIRYKFK